MLWYIIARRQSIPRKPAIAVVMSKLAASAAMSTPPGRPMDVKRIRYRGARPALIAAPVLLTCRYGLRISRSSVSIM